MSTTVVVRFLARPGEGERLVAWLRGNQPGLRAFAGFEHIALFREEGEPDRVVEIERWARADDHRAMVETVGERGGWDALGEMLAEEPRTIYLEELASLGR